MPRNVRTARGDVVDFDTIRIKQQLADAPMLIEVERRKSFIDSKESRAKRNQQQSTAPATVESIEENFEIDDLPAVKLPPVEAVPDIPKRG